MNVYTCTAFKGRYPVGVAAVVVEENCVDAASALEHALFNVGLAQTIAPKDMELLVTTAPNVEVLCNGDY